MECGLADHLKTLLTCQKSAIVKETYWTLSNLVVSSHEICLDLLKDPEIFQRVIIGLNDPDIHVRTEALYTLTHSVS